MRLTRAESKAQTRAQLLEAAVEVFAQKGYAAASVDEIAEAAGFTIGALYAHFGHKAGLFLAALERHYEQDLREIDRLCTSSELFPDGLDSVVRFVDTDEHRQWWLLSIECWLQAMRDDAVRERLAELEERCRAGIANIIVREFADLGATPSNAKEFAAIAIGLSRGLVMQRFLDPEAVPPEMLSTALARLFVGWTNTHQQSTYREE